MACKRNSNNALLTALVDKGINLILPPRDSVKPGQLILVEPDYSMRIASWNDIFGLKENPSIEEESGFSAFRFDTASVMEANATATLLGRLLETFGFGSGRFKSAFDSANAQTIELSLIASASLALTNLDELLGQLRSANVQPSPNYANRKFGIVYRTWRATGLRLSLFDKANNHVNLTIEGMADLSVDASMSLKREDTGSYAFTADRPLVFGLTLRNIEFENGLVVDSNSKQHHRFRTSAEPNSDKTQDWFIGEDAFVSLPTA